MTSQISRWDVVDYLDSEEAISAYLEAAFEDGDPQLIRAALGDVARAKGMSIIAQNTGLSRESLYKSLRPEGNPRLDTVMKVLDSLGLQLATKPKEKVAAQ